MTSAYDKTKDGKWTNPAKNVEELKAKGLSDSKKQARARARRAHARQQRINAEIDLLYKPLDEWDEEELAKGLPRNLWGKRKAGQLTWVPQAVHEAIVERYQQIVKGKVQELSLPAIRTLEALMGNEERDRKGRPIVSATVKANIATMLMEHVIGKPTQRVEADISVKLQGILAHAMVVPGAEGEVIQGFAGLPPAEDDDEEDESE